MSTFAPLFDSFVAGSQALGSLLGLNPSVEAKPSAKEESVSRLSTEVLPSLEVLPDLTAENPSKYPTWQRVRHSRYQITIQQLKKVLIEKVALKDLSSDQIQALKIEPDLKKFLFFLKSLDGDSKTYRTDYYPKLLERFRELVEKLGEKRLDLKSQKILNALCKMHFLAPIKEEKIGKAYIKHLCGSVAPKDLLNPKVLDQTLKEAMKDKSPSIKWSDRMRKFSANSPLSKWDPAQYSVRSHLTTLQLNKSRKVEILRTACPVVGLCGFPDIDPLFLGYLRSLEENERHLYVNHQSHDPSTDRRRHSLIDKFQAQLECNRAEVLSSLTEHPDYDDKFFMLSLPHDSDFYNQEGTPENLHTQTFIQQFMLCLDNNEQGFFISDNIEDRKVLMRKISKALKEVTELYFENLTVLSKKERLEFIDIAYAFITEQIMLHCEITHANDTCKDAVDRGPGASAILKQKCEPKTSEEDLLYIVSIAATMNHARAPIKHRTERSLAAIGRMRTDLI